MKAIYEMVIDRLKNEVPELRYIDMDYGQLEQTNPTVSYPCALVTLNYPDCRSLTDTIQDCRAEIVLRLAFDPLNAGTTTAQAPDEVRKKSLTPYDTITNVYKAIQGWNDIQRKQQGKENRSDLFIYKQVYRFDFEDHTASKE